MRRHTSTELLPTITKQRISTSCRFEIIMDSNNLVLADTTTFHTDMGGSFVY
jgi:hypothetical protein